MPRSSSPNADTKIDQVARGDQSGSVVDDVDEETPRRVESYMNPVEKLKDRLSRLEIRLWQADLLEKPENFSQSKANTGEKTMLERSASDDRSEHMNLRDQTNLSPSRDELGDEKNQHEIRGSLKDAIGREDSAEVLVNKIDTLEKSLEESGHLKDKLAWNQPRLPTIPPLHYVEWSDFKNILAREEETHAIDVLIGGAKYYFQLHQGGRKNRQRWKHHSNGRDKPATEYFKSRLVPERIRINSKAVLMILSEIDPTIRHHDPIVMLRPFKSLIYNEARIRRVFQQLETKWGVSGTGDLTNHVVNSTITKHAGDSTASTGTKTAPIDAWGC